MSTARKSEDCPFPGWIVVEPHGKIARFSKRRRTVSSTKKSLNFSIPLFLVAWQHPMQLCLRIKARLSTPSSSGWLRWRMGVTSRRDSNRPSWPEERQSFLESPGKMSGPWIGKCLVTSCQWQPLWDTWQTSINILPLLRDCSAQHGNPCKTLQLS